MEVESAFQTVSRFQGDSSTTLIGELETDSQGLDCEASEALCEAHNITLDFVEAAGILKRMAAQTDVVIHAVGNLRCIPAILDVGEKFRTFHLERATPGEGLISRRTQR